MAATVSFICPECKAQLRGPAEMQGKKGRCKRCGHTFVLKAAAPAKAGPPAAAGRNAKAPAPASAKPGKPDAAPKKKPADSDAGSAMYAFQEDKDFNKIEGSKSSGSSIPMPKTGDKPKIMDVDHNPYAVTELDLTPRCPFCAKEMESEEAIICLHCGYNTQTRMHRKTQRTYANTPQEMFIWWLPGIVCVLIGLAAVGGILYLWLGINPNDPKHKEAWYANGDLLKAAQVWGTIVAGFTIWIAGYFAVKRLILNPAPPELEKK
jgi:DNA-directed RNA polymerase subunit RPC12/RpoP